MQNKTHPVPLISTRFCDSTLHVTYTAVRGKIMHEREEILLHFENFMRNTRTDRSAKWSLSFLNDSCALEAAFSARASCHALYWSVSLCHSAEQRGHFACTLWCAERHKTLLLLYTIKEYNPWTQNLDVSILCCRLQIIHFCHVF